MARKYRPTPRTPVAPPAAPLPAEILRGPADFAARLAAAEPRTARYALIALLSSLLSGVAYALLVRQAVNLAASLTENGPPAFLAHVTNVFGGVFLGVCSFLLMWGVAHLVARREGRAAEVYGATFSVYPPLYLLVAVLALLLPAALPEQTTGSARELERAALRAAAYTPAATLLFAVTFLGPLVQGALAYPAFRRLTGDRGRALAASTLPLLPALLLGVVGIAALLFNR